MTQNGYNALGQKATFETPKLEDIMKPAKTWHPMSALAKNAVPGANVTGGIFGPPV